MQFKSLSLIIISFFALVQPTAAQPAILLQKAAKVFSTEKVFAQINKANFEQGETIKLEVFFYEGASPSLQGTTAKVQLISALGNVVTETVVPIFNAHAPCSIRIKKNTASGIYFIRAFSNATISQGSVYGYTSLITIGRKDEFLQPIAYQSKPFFKVKVNANKLIAGIVNEVYISSVDQYQKPLFTQGAMLNQHNDTLFRFTVNKDGNAVIRFTPNEQIEYSICSMYKDTVYRCPLPIEKAEGASIWVNENDTALVIKTAIGNGLVQKKHVLVGEYEYNLLFAIPMQENQKESSIKVLKKTLPTGIIRLVLLDEEDNAIAEHFTFSNYLADTLSIANDLLVPATKNTVASELDIDAAMMVAIKEIEKEVAENILTRFFITSHIAENVYYKADFFSPNSRNDVRRINLLLQTNKLLKPSWKEILDLPITAAKNIKYDYINFEGRLKKVEGKFPKDSLINFIVNADSTSQFQQVKINSDSTFRLEGLIFSDTASVFYTTNNVKGSSPQLVVEIISAPLQQQLTFKQDDLTFIKEALQYKFVTNTTTNIGSNKQDNADSLDQSTTLKGVVVKSTKTAQQKTKEVEKKYTKGAFASGYAKVLDLVNNPPTTSPMPVLKYISLMYPQIDVKQFGLFLDEGISTLENLESIMVKDIALIKIFRWGFVGNLSNLPAIAIYTRKYDDPFLQDKINGLQHFNIMGYPSVTNALNNGVVGNGYQTSAMVNEKAKIFLPLNLFKKKNFLAIEGFTMEGRLIFSVIDIGIMPIKEQ